ncbi:DUF2550 domain-containing protein [Propionibacteriaceae bacterium Y2011]
MPADLLWDVGIALLVLLVVLVLPVIVVVIRARWLTRLGGSFDCSLRVDHDTPGTGWALGVARYRADELEWFRYYAVSLRPKLTLGRTAATVLEIRDPDNLEALALYAGHRVVRLEVPARRGSAGSEPCDLAMSAESVTGLLSWLESAPPGQAPRSTTSPHSA